MNHLVIVVEQQGFTRDFCRLSSCSIIDLETHVDHPVIMGSPKPGKCVLSECVLYQLYNSPQDSIVGFTSILIRMYINFVSEALSDLDVRLEKEDIMLAAIYKEAAKLMYGFWNLNVSFFFIFFFNLPPEYNKTLFCS